MPYINYFDTVFGNDNFFPINNYLMENNKVEHNPYQTPASNVSDVATDAENAEAIRKEYINHEASVRSVGILYYLGAISLLFVGIFQLFAPSESADSLGFLLAMSAVLVGLGVLYYWIGSGLRNLRNNVRSIAGVFAVLGLLGFPMGTLINAYILYLLFSKKGKMVFSEEYRAVIDATPHVKYKTSIVVWILLVLLLLAVAMAVIVPAIQNP